MKESKDKFSNQARQYQKFRPHYPEILYNFIYSKLQSFDSAWDCGTGNGQVAGRLAESFKEVFATDISEKQLQEAIRADNITYSVNRAEQTSFPDNSFDLITVAQAIHWFDLDCFYKEARRVAKPKAVIAVWGYNLLRISAEINELIDYFYGTTLDTYWDPERRLVEDEYRSLPFPFQEFEAPEYEIVADWSFEQLIGYFNSWSAVQNYIKANGTNPVNILEKQLHSLWQVNEVKKICFKVFLRIGTIDK